jgi:hypothetical protein
MNVKFSDTTTLWQVTQPATLDTATEQVCDTLTCLSHPQQAT